MSSVTQSDTVRATLIPPARRDHKNVTAEKNGILENVAIGVLAVPVAILARIFALTSTGLPNWN